MHVFPLKMRGVVSDTNLRSSFFLLLVKSTHTRILKTFALNNAFRKGAKKKKKEAV